MSDPVEDERRDLVATFSELGPDHPTLCDGWDTRLLLAHLVRRERSVTEAAARLPVPALVRLGERSLESYAQGRNYAALLRTFGAGSPRWSPISYNPLKQLVNLLEYVVHHEDARRGEGTPTPRVLPADREKDVFDRLRGFAKVTMRSVPVTTQLISTTGGSITVGSGEIAVRVTGAPVELALVAFGRQRAALVDYSGSEADIAAVSGAALGA